MGDEGQAKPTIAEIEDAINCGDKVSVAADGEWSIKTQAEVVADARADGLRDGEAKGREEAAAIAESMDIPAVIPKRSQSTWAGKNYCGGWNQAKHAIAREIRRARKGGND